MATLKNRIVDTARALFISPEVAAALAIGSLALFFPTISRVVGSKVLTAELGLLTTLQSAPVVLTVATWYLGKDLLNPNEQQRKELVGWSQYWRLVLRIRIALIWGVIGIMFTAIGIVAALAGRPRMTIAAIAIGIAIAAVGTVTTALAAMTSKDILDGA